MIAVPDDIPHAARRHRRHGHPAARRARGHRPVPRAPASGSTSPSSSCSAAATSSSADDNPADGLARRIGRTIPLVYGGGDVGAVAAMRWKTQVNENAKVPAFWPTPCPSCATTRSAAGASTATSPARCFTLVQPAPRPRAPAGEPGASTSSPSVLDEVVAGVDEVRAEGEGELAQLLDLILVGDFVSLHMAAQEGIDPGPIPVLDDIKAAAQAPG